MPKPTILQTLLGKPSKNYATYNSDQQNEEEEEDNYSNFSSNSTSNNSKNKNKFKSFSNSLSSISNSSNNGSTRLNNNKNKKLKKSFSSDELGYYSTSTSTSNNWEWNLFNNGDKNGSNSKSELGDISSTRNNTNKYLRSYKSNDSIGKNYDESTSNTNRTRKKSNIDRDRDTSIGTSSLNNNNNNNQDSQNYFSGKFSSPPPTPSKASEPSRRYSTSTSTQPSNSSPLRPSSSFNSNLNSIPPYHSSPTRKIITVPTISITNPSPIAPSFISVPVEDEDEDEFQYHQENFPIATSTSTSTSSSSSNNKSNQNSRPILIPLKLELSPTTTTSTKNVKGKGNELSFSDSSLPSIPSNLIPSLSPRNRNFIFLDVVLEEEEEEIEIEEEEEEEDIFEESQQEIDVTSLNFSRKEEQEEGEIKRFGRLGIGIKEKEKERPDSIYFDFEVNFEDDQMVEEDELIEKEQKVEEEILVQGSRNNNSISSSRPKSIYFDTVPFLNDVSISRNNSFKNSRSSTSNLEELEEYEEEEVIEGRTTRPVSMYFDALGLDLSEEGDYEEDKTIIVSSTSTNSSLASSSESIQSQSLHSSSKFLSPSSSLSSINQSTIIQSPTKGRIYTMDEFFSTSNSTTPTKSPSTRTNSISNKKVLPKRISSVSPVPIVVVVPIFNSNSTSNSNLTSNSISNKATTSTTSPTLSILSTFSSSSSSSSNTNSSTNTNNIKFSSDRIGSTWQQEEEEEGYSSPPSTIISEFTNFNVNNKNSDNIYNEISEEEEELEELQEEEKELEKVIIRTGWTRAMLIPRPSSILRTTTTNSSTELPSTNINGVSGSGSGGRDGSIDQLKEIVNSVIGEIPLAEGKVGEDEKDNVRLNRKNSNISSTSKSIPIRIQSSTSNPNLRDLNQFQQSINLNLTESSELRRRNSSINLEQFNHENRNNYHSSTVNPNWLNNVRNFDDSTTITYLGNDYNSNSGYGGIIDTTLIDAGNRSNNTHNYPGLTSTNGSELNYLEEKSLEQEENFQINNNSANRNSIYLDSFDTLPLTSLNNYSNVTRDGNIREERRKSRPLSASEFMLTNSGATIPIFSELNSNLYPQFLTSSTSSSNSNRNSQYSINSLSPNNHNNLYNVRSSNSLRSNKNNLPRATTTIFEDTSFIGTSTSAISNHNNNGELYTRPSKNPKRFNNNLNNGNGNTMKSISLTANIIPTSTTSSNPTIISSVFNKRKSLLLLDSNSINSNQLLNLSKPFNPNRDLMISYAIPPPLLSSSSARKIKNDEILIQILVVGLDSWDFEMTKKMSNKLEGIGFIPGRGFVGKVLECGVEAKVHRGDLVFGLNDLRKSGALAERLLINRNLVTLAPNCGLSLEHIATLPTIGVPAILAMESLCNTLPKGSKILILNAHEGVGNLCLQLTSYFRSTKDLWIIAHCSPNVNINQLEGENYCFATGASEVIVDEVLATINSLHESSIDVVIDTIGGRRIYEASRRILHFNGSFYTTIGDTLAPSLDNSTHFKSSMRSLRRSFFKKDQKQINYWCVALEDDRETTSSILDTLRDAVERGGIRTIVTRVWNFENGCEAFENWDAGEGRVIQVQG